MPQARADAPAVEPPFSPLRVRAKAEIAHGIFQFDLERPDGATLPAFTAGAHITVSTPSGARRNYSLCSAPSNQRLYQIALKRDTHGRGGSVSMADRVQTGDTLLASAPRNNFELPVQASEILFIAGGIGITPIMSMLRHLQEDGRTPWRLRYLTRDAASTAFLDELRHAPYAGKALVHHDQGDPDRALDLWPLLERPTRAHVFCCGPRGLMDSVRDMSGHWPSANIHFESFGVDAGVAADDRPFRVRLARSGVLVEVGANQSILQALRASGILVPSSCESGTCGTCRVGLLEGQAEHRDMVLMDDEQSSQIMACVSRARSGELLLDL
jgi:phthalate 4,5-dioxygenase reductase subunit